jgi:hypothetical protein
MSDTPSPADQLAASNEHAAEMTRNMDKLLNKTRELHKLTGDLNDKHSEAKAIAEAKLRILDKEAENIAEAKANYEEIKANLHEQIAAEVKKGVLTGAALDQRNESLRLINIEISELERRNDLSPEYLASLRAEGDALRDNKDTLDEYGVAARAANQAAQDGVGALTGIGDQWKQSVSGAILYDISMNGIGAALSNIGGGLMTALNPMNIAGSLITGMVQQTLMLAKANDDARASFAAATGHGNKYAGEIESIRTSTTKYGVNADEAQQALHGLMTSMAGFKNMGSATRAELSGLAAIMGEVGVSAEEAGKIFQMGTKTLGLSAPAALQMTTNLHALSGVLGKDFAGVAGDFNAVMGDLAVYGKDAPKVFAKLAGAASELGMEVGSLVDSMKELDTIEGASRRAGELNAALGGQFLDTHELLNASMEDRVVMLKEAIDASGKDLSSMSRAEKQMVANAAGLKDVGELANMMNTDMNQLTSTMEEAGNASGSVGDLGTAAAAGMGFMEKFGKVLEKLAFIIDPLVQWVHGLLDSFLAMEVTNVGRTFMLISAAVAILAYNWKTMVNGLNGGMSALKSAPAAMKGMMTSVQGAGGAMKDAFAANKTAGGGIKGLIKSTWAFVTGKAAEATATVTGTAACGADTVCKEANAEATEGAAKGGKGFVATLKSLLNAVKGNIPALLALGATFIMIGIGVFIAAYGVAELVRSFAGFSAGEILAISVALLVFGATMVGLLYMLVLALPLLAGAGTGLLYFGGAVILVAIGVLILAAAFMLFANALLLLVPHAESLIVLAAGLLLLALAGMMMLPGGIMAAIGLGAMAVGLGLLAVALAFISTDDLVALGGFFNVLAASFMVFANALIMLVPYAVGLIVLAVGLGMLALAGALMLPAGAMAAIGLVALAAGLGVLAIALAFISTDDLVALAGIFSGLAAVAGLAGGGLAKAAPVVSDLLDILSDVADDITEETLERFASLGAAFIQIGHGAGYALKTLPDIPPLFNVLSTSADMWTTSLVSLNLEMTELLLKVPPFESFLESIAELTEEAVDRMSTLAEAVADLAEALNEIDGESTIAFTNMIRTVTESAPQLTPSAVANIDGLVKAAEQYSEIKFESVFNPFGLGGGDDKFVAMVKALGGSGGGGKRGGGGAPASAGGGGAPAASTVVVLELDGKELGRTVEKLLGKRNKLKTAG